MLRQITLLIAVFLFGAILAAPNVDATGENTIDLAKSDDEGRIINGTKVPPKKHKYMCSLQRHDENGYSKFCGGTLIHRKWVLTAAHCVAEEAKSGNVTGMHAVCGSTGAIEFLYYPKNTTAQVLPVYKIYIHQRYKKAGAGDDIALLELKEAAEMNEWVAPIAMAPPRYDPVGKMGVNIGWGAIHPTNRGNSSWDLLEGPGRVLDPEECVEKHGWVIRDDQICIFHNESATCSGDSGGPHIHTLPNGQVIQVGIVSYGAASGCSDAAGVFTKVSSFLPWIRDVFRGNYHKYDILKEPE